MIFLLISCASTNKMSQTEDEKWKPDFRVQAGINHGGIVENTDMSEIENVEVDAFSGATKTGFNAGIHTLLPIKRNNIEIGVDYMQNNQTFTYKDVLNAFNGEREVKTSQFIVPLTYNIGVLRKKYSEGLFQIKIGYVFQFNSFNISDKSPNLPAYTTNNLSSGLTLGLATTPITLMNDTKLGCFFDIYRGSQVYDDFYNKSTFEMPGSSYFKAGVIYQFTY